MKIFSSKNLVTLLFIVMIIGSAVLLLWVTDNGIGLTTDSTIYLTTAKSLIAGRGFNAFGEPMTHYPPIYPLLLAAAGSFNSDITVSARWLHALLYGLNGVLFVFNVSVVTKRSLFAMLASGILYYSSEYLLDIHAYAWSDSVFITFALLTVLCLVRYTSTQNLKWMYLSAFAVSLAMCTRYVGINLLPAVIIVFLFISKLQLKQRIEKALLIIGISGLPLAIWLLRNLLVVKNAVDRVIAYHPVDADSYHDIIGSLHNYILPSAQSWWINLIELSGIVLIFSIILFKLIKYYWKGHNRWFESEILVFIGIAYSITYLLFILVSKAYFDALTLFNHRILSPVFIYFSLAAISIMYAYSVRAKNKAAWAVFLLCVLLVGRANIVSIVDSAFYKRNNGLGLNNEIFHQSPLLKGLSKLDNGLILYSNGYREIGFLTGQNTASLPQKYNAMSNLDNSLYQTQIAAMCENVNSGKGLIVSLRLINNWDIYPAEDEIERLCTSPILYDEFDGLVFGLKDISIPLP